jgi:hypothetical protein
MQAADHVDLRRPGGARFSAFFEDVVERQGVAPLVLDPFAEGAEGAAVDAEIGVVDMPVDVEVDPVAVLPPVGQGGQLADGKQVVGGKKLQRLGVGDAGTVFNLGADVFEKFWS